MNNQYLDDAQQAYDHMLGEEEAFKKHLEDTIVLSNQLIKEIGEQYNGIF